jgi:thiopeptide-type bacteriocin biosynthesis protein
VRVRHDEQLARRIAQAAAQTSVAKVLGVAYQRELDRYGGDACIEAAEAVFHQSSRLALSLLQAGGRRGQYFGYAGTFAVAALTMADLNIDAALGRYEHGIESVVRGIDERAAAIAPAATMQNVAAHWRHWGEMFARNPEQAPPHAASYLRTLRDYIARVRQEAGAHRIEDIVGSQIHMTCNRMALSVVDELCMMRALRRSVQPLEAL